MRVFPPSKKKPAIALSRSAALAHRMVALLFSRPTGNSSLKHNRRRDPLISAAKRQGDAERRTSADVTLDGNSPAVSVNYGLNDG